VPDGKLGRAFAARADACITGNAFSRPERELQIRLQVKKSDGAVLELRAHDTFGLQAEPIAVEPDRPLQIVDPERDERYPGFHGQALREACA